MRECGFWIGAKTLLAVLALIVLVSGGATATGSGSYPYGGQGTWSITKDTLVSGEEVVVNGDLVIEEGARLVLLDSTILINCTYPGQYKVLIRSGGTLDISATSSIQPANSSNNYTFVVERAPSGWLLDPKAAFFIGGLVGLGLGFPLGILATAYSYKRWFSRNLPPPV